MASKDLDRMIELRREAQRADPQRETKHWAEELAKAERMRGGYLDQQAEGVISMAELKSKLAALDERRAAAERELAANRKRSEEFERLQSDRDAVVRYYADLAPEALDSLEPAERQKLYKMLRLKVMLGDEGQAWAELPITRRPASLDSDPAVYRNGVIPKCARTDAR